MTSILKVNPPPPKKIRPFPIKTRVVWGLGMWHEALHHSQSESTSSLNNIFWNIFLILDESLANHLRWNQFTDDNNFPQSSVHNLYSYSVYVEYKTCTWHPGKNWCTKKLHTKTTPQELWNISKSWGDSLRKNSLHSELAFLFCVDKWDASLRCSSIYCTIVQLWCGRSAGFDHRWAPSNYNLYLT